ncbi:hypothetical protein ACLIKD_01755 [Azonexus sp. IMCC34842]|uniref:hypothetical protein n=1 Tax=Azonexus sp. IMCC34842 TaxID=3420950 RepID=UPI003D0E6725
MQKPIILTSIPPNIKRTEKNGAVLDLGYMQACIDSWIEAGFTPISVNSRREFSTPPKHINGIDYVLVDRDAYPFVGKPLVYIQDVIRIGAERSNGPIVMTNADILLRISPKILASLTKLQPGQFIAERRLDIFSLDCTNGKEFSQGYDFFAFHSTDISTYSDEGFVFGVPWWDHYLPLKMLLSGLEKINILEPFVYHLQHDERWEPDLWRMYGGIFTRIIARDIKDAEHEKPTKKIDYLHEFKTILEKQNFPFRKISNIANRFFIFKNLLHDAKLAEIARLNIRFIEAEPHTTQPPF